MDTLNMTQAPTKAPMPAAPKSSAPKKLKRHLDDNAFLAADLEILETPPSPVRMALILIIAAFVVVAIGWSWLGKIEIIAVAQGKIQPTGRVKVIQPLEPGKVAAVHIENGRHVSAGDVLIEMERGDSLAERDEAATVLASFRAEVLRHKASITAASQRPILKQIAILWTDDIPVSNQSREETALKADLSQLASAVGSLDAQIHQKEVERDRLEQTMAEQAKLIATLNERVEMRNALIGSLAGSRAIVLDALESLQTQTTMLSTQKSQHDVAVANLDVLTQEREKAITAFIADNAEKLVTAQRQLDDYQQRLAKAQVRLDHTKLTAPIDGTVLGLTVTTIGQVLTSGEEIMRIVPEDATLEIESYLPNKDIGFVKVGQQAVIKVASFPFTRYGTISATVTRIGHDAIPEPEAQQSAANATQAHKPDMFATADHTQNLVFPVTLSLQRPHISVDGEQTPLSPGMAVDVEIKTGSRRILDYFLSPLVEVGSRAMHER